MIAVPESAAPRVSIADVSAYEGESGTSGMVFTVSLSHVSAAPVSVQYQTANGTAVAPAREPA